MQVIPIYNAYGFNLENKVYSNYTGGLVYQFDPVFNFDPFIPFVNLSLPTTTIAVHKTKDVYFSYFLKDQNGSDLSYTNEIADNHYVNSIDIDVLNSNTNVFRKNYITGSFQDNFTITNIDNINLFSQYNKDFGVRINISGRDAKTHINNIYVLGNALELNKVNVSYGIGSWSNLDPIGYQTLS